MLCDEELQKVFGEYKDLMVEAFYTIPHDSSRVHVLCFTM